MEHLHKLENLIKAWEVEFPMRALSEASNDAINVRVAQDVLSRNSMSVGAFSGQFFEEVPATNVFRIDNQTVTRKKKRAVEVLTKNYPLGTAEFVTGGQSSISCDIEGLDTAGSQGYMLSIEDRIETPRGFYLQHVDWLDNDRWGTYATDLTELMFKQLKAFDELIGKYFLDAIRQFRKVNRHRIDSKIFPEGDISYVDPSDLNANLIAHILPMLRRNGMADAVCYDGFCTVVGQIQDQFESNQTGTESNAVKWGALPIVVDEFQMLDSYPDEMFFVRPDSVHLATYTDYAVGSKERILSEDLILTTVQSPSFGQFGVSYDVIIKRKCNANDGVIMLKDHFKLACNLQVFNNPSHPKDGTPDVLVLKKRPIVKPTPQSAIPVGFDNTYGAVEPTTDFGSVTVPADSFTATDANGNALTVTEGKLTFHANSHVSDVIDGQEYDVTLWGAAVSVTGLVQGTYSVKWTGKVDMGSGVTTDFVVWKDVYIPCENC